MTKVYLDWNIFNKIEKIESLDSPEKAIYESIERMIIDKTIIVPYSNAHINDLYRGYTKNPDFVSLHLNTLNRLTNTLCIVQYWGEKVAKWHYRDPEEFLESTIEENIADDLFSTTDDDPEIESLKKVRNMAMEQIPIPIAFNQIYSFDPIFDSIYPRTKVEMNMLAMCRDLQDFNNNIKRDYVLYKNYRKFLNQCKLKYPEIRKTLSKTEMNIENPQNLTWNEIWEIAEQKYVKINVGDAYQKVVDLYTKTDLKGYKPDERFANLIDDALHTFYAAHCDVFVTNDVRCLEKAIKVYQQLKIKTAVLNAENFIDYMQKTHAAEV